MSLAYTICEYRFTTGSGKCAPCVLAMTIMIQIDCSCIDVCLSGSSSCTVYPMNKDAFIVTHDDDGDDD